MLYDIGTEYDAEIIITDYAKQRGLSVIIKYGSYSSGYESLLDTVIFHKFKNIEDFCEIVGETCIDYLENDDIVFNECLEYKDDFFVYNYKKAVKVVNVNKDINLDDNFEYIINHFNKITNKN